MVSKLYPFCFGNMDKMNCSYFIFTIPLCKLHDLTYLFGNTFTNQFHLVIFPIVIYGGLVVYVHKKKKIS